METKNTIYESKIYQKLDLADFSMWLNRNINLILNKKQTKIFNKFKMCFEDLKLFGKSTCIEKYYKTHLRGVYEKDSFSWILNYSVVK